MFLGICKMLVVVAKLCLNKNKKLTVQPFPLILSQNMSLFVDFCSLQFVELCLFLCTSE